MSQTNDILQAINLAKSFGKGSARTHVLRGLDMTLREGEYLAVMGPSGCGKSTLLHVLGLMTHADAGQLWLRGEEVPLAESRRTLLRRREIGFVFQRFNLLPVLSAIDNIRISLRVRGVAENGQVDDLLGAMGVRHVARRKPSAMSIGEQQRVAVARALAHRPGILLADEPTGNLDSANSEILLNLFDDIHRERGQSIVLITHSPEAAARADRILHMQDGIFPDASSPLQNDSNP